MCNFFFLFEESLLERIVCVPNYIFTCVYLMTYFKQHLWKCFLKTKLDEFL
ncbi:hypothetical protein Nmel_006656, partial [Mimus melanotis]